MEPIHCKYVALCISQCILLIYGYTIPFGFVYLVMLLVDLSFKVYLIIH